MDSDPQLEVKPLPSTNPYTRLLVLEQSRPNYPHDKPSADFIQRYGIVAIKCFLQREKSDHGAHGAYAF
jgi:hypothetical protein